MTLDYLTFTADEIPCKKVFDIDGEIYGIEIFYNDVFDFYTMYIYDNDNNLLFSTKLNYLTDALNAVCDGLNINRRIVPLNEADVSKDYPEIEHVGSDNFDAMKVCLI
jgi:hypothetical protein